MCLMYAMSGPNLARGGVAGLLNLIFDTADTEQLAIYEIFARNVKINL